MPNDAPIRLQNFSRQKWFQWLLDRSYHLFIKGSLEVLTSDYTESCRWGLAASMFDSIGVLQRRCETWEILAGRNRGKCHVFPSLCGFESSQSQLRKARWCGRLPAKDVDKICTAPARERDLEAKTVKTPQVLGTFFDVQTAFRVTGAGISTRCNNIGRRGGFEEGPKWCFSRGRRNDFLLCDVDVWSLGRWIRGRVANFMLWKCYLAGIISHGSYRSLYASAPTFSWQGQYFWSIDLKIGETYCNSEVKCLVNMSFLKEVSQKSLTASFLIFKASFLKEVSQNPYFKVSFLQGASRKASFFSFEGSLAEKEFSKSLESQTNWQPDHFYLKPIDNPIIRITHQLTTKFIWTSSRITSKGPNHLNLKPIDNQSF